MSAGAIQKNNDTDKPMMILLNDGSSVVLQPGGHLSYSEGANKKRREVTLTGKAFFEIVKNKEKPFLVYSYGLATKVLGTSFMIDASEENKDIKVEVRTGTVAVFSINNLDNKKRNAELDKPELEGVTLNHDQMIAFSREAARLFSCLQNRLRRQSDKDVSKQRFVFDETPVSEVFRILEMFTTWIVYDRDKDGQLPIECDPDRAAFHGKARSDLQCAGCAIRSGR
jgi:transmembrane sensor